MITTYQTIPLLAQYPVQRKPNQIKAKQITIGEGILESKATIFQKCATIALDTIFLHSENI